MKYLRGRITFYIKWINMLAVITCEILDFYFLVSPLLFMYIYLLFFFLHTYLSGKNCSSVFYKVLIFCWNKILLIPLKLKGSQCVWIKNITNYDLEVVLSSSFCIKLWSYNSFSQEKLLQQNFHLFSFPSLRCWEVKCLLILKYINQIWNMWVKMQLLKVNF